MNRPITTLFMLQSLDGKISTGGIDFRDMDKDLPKIKGVKEGLHQYYEIEQTTDLWTLSSGAIRAKLGINTEDTPEKTELHYVVIDNKHLNNKGVHNLCSLAEEAIIVTTNNEHPAFEMLKQESNLHIIYQEKLCLESMLIELKQSYGCEALTVQTGGTLNALLFKDKLIDYINIVIAPIVIGGTNTPTTVDGESITLESELSKLNALRLTKCKMLEDSYIQLCYEVIKET